MKKLTKHVYPLITFVLALKASALGGRAMWIDEITRISSQKNYTIAQLLDCKNLRDFDSQSPIAYLLFRPIQSLLGIEWGGYLISAFSAAVVVAVALWLLRRWKGSPPSGLASLFVALSPLAIYFGGELWFYEPWAAAFAVAFVPMLTWNDETTIKGMLVKAALLIVFGYLFVALHFAGIFIWFIVCLVAFAGQWIRKGFQTAVLFGVLLLLPALFNLPIYLAAQHAAKHLGSQTLQFDKLGGVLSGVCEYVADLLPSLTGASILGVIALALGAVILVRRRCFHELVLFLSAIFAIFFYMTYSGLREYMMPAVRYWTYASAPTLALTAFGFEWLLIRHRAGKGVLALAILVDCLAVVGILQMEGRVIPFKRIVKVVGEGAPAGPVIFPNHYETRPFVGPYPFDPSHRPVFPCYWEQGEQARQKGVGLIHRLSPLSPMIVYTDDLTDWGKVAGVSMTNAFVDAATTCQRVAAALHLMPEPMQFRGGRMKVVFPTLEGERALTDFRDEALTVPFGAWQFVQMRPRTQTEPFVPAMELAAGSTGCYDVYLPRSWKGGKARLELVMGSRAKGDVTVNGQKFQLDGSFRPYNVKLGAVGSGEKVAASFSTLAGAIVLSIRVQEDS